MLLAPDALFDAALAGPPAGQWWVRFADGRRRRMPVRRWLGPTGEADERVLDRACGPVLDVGCGPGRHLRALGARGLEAVGLDTSSTAVALARRDGSRVIRGSIWDEPPACARAGGWGTILLLDGNVGIGGRPAGLLRRSLALLAPDGRVLVETLRAPLDVPGLVQLEGPAGRSHPFPWSFVAADGLEALAARTGLAVTGSWDCAGRAFAQLEPRAPGRRP